MTWSIFFIITFNVLATYSLEFNGTTQSNLHKQFHCKEKPENVENGASGCVQRRPPDSCSTQTVSPWTNGKTAELQCTHRDTDTTTWTSHKIGSNFRRSIDNQVSLNSPSKWIRVLFYWKHSIHYADYLPLLNVSLILFHNAWNASFPQTFQWHPVSIKDFYFVPRPDVAGVDEHVHLVSHFDLLVQRFFLIAVRFSSLNFSFPMSNLWDCSSTIRPYFCDLWSPLPNFEFFALRSAAQDFLDLERPSEHSRLE